MLVTSHNLFHFHKIASVQSNFGTIWDVGAVKIHLKVTTKSLSYPFLLDSFHSTDPRDEILALHGLATDKP
jgi:hypothetical protein